MPVAEVMKDYTMSCESEDNTFAHKATVETEPELEPAEAALRAAELKSRALLEYAPIGVFQASALGRVLFANPAFAAMLGYQGPEHLIDSVVDIRLEVFANIEDHGKLHQMLLDKGEANGLEVEFRRADNTTFWGLINVRGVLEENGTLMYCDGFVADITERRLAVERLKKSRQQMRNLARHLEDAREKERTRIAREIHDELGQLLTALKMDVTWIKNAVKSEPGREELLGKIAAMGGLIDSTQHTVHRISTELRPGVLDDLGLTTALEWLAREFTTRTGADCERNLAMDDALFTPDQATVLFRIAQEALTNVMRHARADHVVISLAREGDWALLTVADNGIGLDPAKFEEPESFGLLGIKERVHALGGEVAAFPTKGRGTVLSVRLRLEKEAGQ